MLEHPRADLDRVFRALAHPVRREILQRLARGERTISELAAPFDMTLEGVSQHVRSLERAGLLRRSRRGRHHVCHFDPRPLDDPAETLRRLAGFWSGRLDALDELLGAGED